MESEGMVQPSWQEHALWAQAALVLNAISDICLLSLGFPICKVGTIILPTSSGDCEDEMRPWL